MQTVYWIANIKLHQTKTFVAEYELVCTFAVNAFCSKDISNEYFLWIRNTSQDVFPNLRHNLCQYR